MSGKITTPVWLVIIGLVALAVTSITFAKAGMVLLVGGVAVAVALVLLKQPTLTIAEVLSQVDSSRAR